MSVQPAARPTETGAGARIVFLIKVPRDRKEEFLAAYERVRYLVADGVPGHVVDQVCQSATDPEQWLITSEWTDLDSFLRWEATEEHRQLVKPMRECFTEGRSLRFTIHQRTRGTVLVFSHDDRRPA